MELTDEMKLSEADKKINLTIMFYFWFKSAEYSGVYKSTAIQSLIKFMVTEQNWQKKKAAERILTFFKETQGATSDELLDLWTYIMGEN